MADIVPPGSSSTMPVTGSSPARGDRWTSLRSVRVTPPGTSPRLLLRRLPADPGFKVTESELRRRGETAERIGDTMPRLLMEFADRLEAVFSRDTILRLDFSSGPGRGLQAAGKAAVRHASANGDSMDDTGDITLKARRAASRESDSTGRTTETAAATAAKRPPSNTMRAPSPAQNTYDSGTGGHQGDVRTGRDEPSATERGCASATAARCEKRACSGTPGHDTPPVSRPGENLLLWADLRDTQANACPPRDQQTGPPPDQEKPRLYGSDVDSESLVSHSPSRTFSVFVTPRRDQPDPEFKRPSRPRGQLKRSPATDRWRCGAAGSTRSRRSEVQLLAEGSAWPCDAAQTPHRRREQLKPEKVANRWQQLSTGNGGRPRPDLTPSPVVDPRRRCDAPVHTPRRGYSNANHPAADKNTASVSDAAHCFRSELELRAVSDRCQDGGTPRPCRDRPEFKLPPPARWPSSAAARGQTTPRTVLPACGGGWERRPGPPLPSPGGSGDKLRRVHRWLESSASVSVADPTEARRRRQRTPSLAGTSIVSGRQRRRRLEYTEEELHNLQRGIHKYGRDFKAIRLTYEFHPSRTTVDLYDKWRHMAGTPGRHAQGAGDARPQTDTDRP